MKENELGQLREVFSYSETHQNHDDGRKQFYRMDSLTELHEAVVKNSEFDLRSAMDSGVPIDLVDHYGRTALYYASKQGCTNLVDILLENHAHHDITDCNQTSPLWIASQQGHAEIVLALLKHGADPDQQANDQTTALYQASYEGHLMCVYYLVRFHASVQLSKNSGASPVFVAARNGHYRIVKHLLKHGADPSQAQADGRSPLHTAFLYSRLRCARLLISYGSSNWIHESDIYGWTHLHFLAKKGNMPVARLFFHRIRPHFTPLDFEQNDFFGNTPLHIAMSRGNFRFAEFLVKKGFDLDRPNLFHQTPRMIEKAQKNKLTVTSESSPIVSFKQMLNIYRINYTTEEEEMRREVETYVGLLIAEIKNLNALFSNDLICSGSYYERTRVGVQNEFDYMVNLSEIQRLSNFVDDTVDPPGYGRLSSLLTDEAREKLQHYLEPITGCICSTKVRTQFYHLLTSARALVMRQETLQKFKHLKFEWTSGDKRCGTAIHAEWYGNQYPYLNIKIDVVPCLTVYRWPRMAKIACPLSKPQFQIIARSPKSNQTYLWRISTSLTELIDFLSLDDEIKNAYLILKTLRNLNPYECRVGKVIYTSEDLLTSYMLKIEFLGEINRFPHRQHWINGGLIHRVTSILKRLYKHIGHGSIPSFYIENYNVIDGEDYAQLRSFEIKYARILLEQAQDEVRKMDRKLKRHHTFVASEPVEEKPLLRSRATTSYF